VARDSRLLAGVAAALCLAAGLAGSATGQALPGNALVVEHWNGTAWRKTPARGGSELRAVTAISPTDVWAVGERASGSLR
jgi:hypothetical protein